VKSSFTESNTSYLTNHPFGMVMPGRSWTAASAEGYRYGYNGKEGDGEIKGDDNSLDFGARIYDPRICRWLSDDPLYNPNESPFIAFTNNPIWFLDPNGKSIETGTNWEGSDMQETYNNLLKLTSFKELTNRFLEGTDTEKRTRNITLNVESDDPLNKGSFARTNSNATAMLAYPSLYLAGEHSTYFFVNEPAKWSGGNALNDIGRAQLIAHELSHANSYYEIETNDIYQDGEAALAYGGYITTIQTILTEYVKANDIKDISEMDIKALSVVGVDIIDKDSHIIPQIEQITIDYYTAKTGESIDKSSSNYKQNLIKEFQNMRDDALQLMTTPEGGDDE